MIDGFCGNCGVEIPANEFGRRTLSGRECAECYTRHAPTRAASAWASSRKPHRSQSAAAQRSESEYRDALAAKRQAPGTARG